MSANVYAIADGKLQVSDATVINSRCKILNPPCHNISELRDEAIYEVQFYDATIRLPRYTLHDFKSRLHIEGKYLHPLCKFDLASELFNKGGMTNGS